MIDNVEELAEHYGVEERQLAKAVYKSTDCGAWIDTHNKKFIVIGAIVEGSDAEIAFTLWYPFIPGLWEQLVIAVEQQAEAHWNEAHPEEKTGT